MFSQVTPVDQYLALLFINLFTIIFSLSLAFLVYRRSKKFNVWNAGTKSLVAMMLALPFLPLTGIVNAIDTLIGSGEFLNPNGGFWTFSISSARRPPLVRFIGSNFTIIGLTVFIVFYVFYVKETTNLSEFVWKVYNFTVIIMVGLCLMSLVFNLGDFVSQLSSRSNINFFALAVVALLILISSMAFSVIDLHRISSKLLQVRLTMSTLAGCFYICVMLFLALGLIIPSISSTSDLLVNSLYALRILSIIPLTLFLGWSYFVPLKVQEWTGILPPSFKVLVEKEKIIKEL
ncbi:MAG: hypothetical protein ACFFBD_09055 [Candidatus Hodarchaeota archaeon]